MPIDPALLATSIEALGDLDPEPDLPASLQRAVTAVKQLLDADAAGITLTDATGSLHWASGSDQRAQAVENDREACAAGPCAEAFTTGRPAVMYDAYQERRRGGPWGEVSLAIAELAPRSALSVPIDLGGGPIGTLDLYATNPREWDQSEVCALQTYAGVVASLLGTAATAHIGGGLADQLQAAFASGCRSSRLGRG
jgi:GAF domain-containing protein